MKKIIISVLASVGVSTASAQLVHQFYSPAFSGIGWSSHVLTIEQLEATRTQKNNDTPWCSPSGLPNAVRVRACSTAIDCTRDAAPSQRMQCVSRAGASRICA